jgi:tetratricopeptide (TPR) repeat protein
MGFFRNLIHFNKTMKIVAMVVGVASVVVLVMVWRSVQFRSLGQDAKYKGPMRHYSSGEKKMVREKLKQALQEYQLAKKGLEALPGINLEDDFYYAVVLNGIGTILLRTGIYGGNQAVAPEGGKLGALPEKIRESLVYLHQAEKIYKTGFQEHKFSAEEIARLEASRKGKKEDDIIPEVFERYQRGLSVTLCNLGIASRYLGDIKGAIAYYQEALVNWPGQETATDNLEKLQSVPAPAVSGMVEK